MCLKQILIISVVCICAIINSVWCQKSAAKEEKKIEPFACPVGAGSGTFADPETCRRFYQCVDGHPYINYCPAGLLYDDYSKFCTFPNDARCGPLPSTPAPSTEAPIDLAEPCIPDKCTLPYCFCSKDGTEIPGGLDPKDTPQMIILTFDGAINLNNYDNYRAVFKKKRTNPNGCEIKGTFFISHEYSNYQMIQNLANEHHEIGTETISVQQGLNNKGYEEWVGEMVGMREILHFFSNISKQSIVGMRAPYLKPGRNTQYKVLEDFGYFYDSSIGVPPLSVPIWPYTLDFKIPHECKSSTCPTKTFPGVWELPLNTHYVESYEGGHCPYLDQCVLHNHNADVVFEWLQEDFSRHYDQNKAPYMMPFHTNWFSIKELRDGLFKFIDWSLTLPDVWYVTGTQAVTWMAEPKTLDELQNYENFACDKEAVQVPKRCRNSNKCALSFKTPDSNFTDTRYMETCRDCPRQYPWLGDAEGSGIPGRDNYLPEQLRK